MILCCWQRAQHAICQRSSCWLPILLDGVEFWRVCGEVLDADCFLVSTTEVVDEFAVVRWSIIDKQKHTIPCGESFLEKLHEFSLSFALCKRVDKAPLTSCSEYICAHVFVVDEHHGLATSSCPSACNEWNQSEGCLVLGCDDKMSSLVLAHQSSRFFLNAAIVAASACL